MRCLVYSDEFRNITYARLENSVEHCSPISFPLSFIVGDKAPRQPRLSHPDLGNFRYYIISSPPQLPLYASPPSTTLL
jgi:hypothetical protein